MIPTRYITLRTITDLRIPVYDNADGNGKLGYGNAEMVRSFTKVVDENGSYAPKKKKVQTELKSKAHDDFEM